jgi:hypothetical protein
LIDSTNCGLCGRTCSGTTCADGVCGPILLAFGGAVGLAVDSNNVYFLRPTGPGIVAVMSVPIDGGTPATMATASGAPMGIVTDGTNLYWTTGAFGV